MHCRNCKKTMDAGYVADDRWIAGPVPKRYLRSSVWGKKSGFPIVYRCPECGELKFVVNELSK